MKHLHMKAAWLHHWLKLSLEGEGLLGAILPFAQHLVCALPPSVWAWPGGSGCAECSHQVTPLTASASAQGDGRGCF